jgi:hypothetical protein
MIDTCIASLTYLPWHIMELCYKSNDYFLIDQRYDEKVDHENRPQFDPQFDVPFWNIKMDDNKNKENVV